MLVDHDSYLCFHCFAPLLMIFLFFGGSSFYDKIKYLNLMSFEGPVNVFEEA